MRKAQRIYLRLTPEEKQVFQEAAQLAGLDLSAWIRERLRWLARDELMAQGEPNPFAPRSDEQVDEGLRRSTQPCTD